MDNPVCERCGHAGPTRTDTPGSLAIELVLWLCLLVPGLVYSLWRHSARRDVCGLCGSAQLLPPESPRAQALVASLPQPARPVVAARRPSPLAYAMGKLLGGLFKRRR